MASLPLVLNEEQDVRQGESGLALAAGQQVLLQRRVSVMTQPGQPAHVRARVVPVEAATLLRVLRAALRQLLRRDNSRGEGLSCWRVRGEEGEKKTGVGGKREIRRRCLLRTEKQKPHVYIFLFSFSCNSNLLIQLFFCFCEN